MLLPVSVHLTSNMIPLVNYFQIAFLFAYEATYNYYLPLFFLFISTMVSTRDYLITLSQLIYSNYLYIDIRATFK